MHVTCEVSCSEAHALLTHTHTHALLSFIWSALSLQLKVAVDPALLWNAFVSGALCFRCCGLCCALCPMLCPMPYALCPMPCPMLYDVLYAFDALCVMTEHTFPQIYNGNNYMADRFMQVTIYTIFFIGLMFRVRLVLSSTSAILARADQKRHSSSYVCVCVCV